MSFIFKYFLVPLMIAIGAFYLFLFMINEPMDTIDSNGQLITNPTGIPGR